MHEHMWMAVGCDIAVVETQVFFFIALYTKEKEKEKEKRRGKAGGGRKGEE